MYMYIIIHLHSEIIQIHIHVDCAMLQCCDLISVFSLSVGEVVPLLKTVMARMLPMLGLAKLDNMQWVFSNG